MNFRRVFQMDDGSIIVTASAFLFSVLVFDFFHGLLLLFFIGFRTVRDSYPCLKNPTLSTLELLRNTDPTRADALIEETVCGLVLGRVLLLIFFAWFDRYLKLSSYYFIYLLSAAVYYGVELSALSVPPPSGDPRLEKKTWQRVRNLLQVPEEALEETGQRTEEKEGKKASSASTGSSMMPLSPPVQVGADADDCGEKSSSASTGKGPDSDPSMSSTPMVEAESSECEQNSDPSLLSWRMVRNHLQVVLEETGSRAEEKESREELACTTSSMMPLSPPVQADAATDADDCEEKSSCASIGKSLDFDLSLSLTPAVEVEGNKCDENSERSLLSSLLVEQENVQYEDDDERSSRSSVPSIDELMQILFTEEFQAAINGPLKIGPSVNSSTSEEVKLDGYTEKSHSQQSITMDHENSAGLTIRLEEEKAEYEAKEEDEEEEKLSKNLVPSIDELVQTLVEEESLKTNTKSSNVEPSANLLTSAEVELDGDTEKPYPRQPPMMDLENSMSLIIQSEEEKVEFEEKSAMLGNGVSIGLEEIEAEEGKKPSKLDDTVDDWILIGKVGVRRGDKIRNKGSLANQFKLWWKSFICSF